MNTKEFVQVLRKIIKEEVKSAVSEAMRDISVNNLVESVEYIQEPIINKSKTIKKSEPKSFVKDPLLNSLLNETAKSGAHIPMEHNDYSEWPTLDMKSNFSSIMGSPKFAQSQKIDATPEGINPNAVPEEIKSVLTRDYRSLMKAMDKKKNK